MKNAVPKERPLSGRSSSLTEPEKPKEVFVYHWGRIFAALFVLILALGGLIWGAFEISGTGEEEEALVENQEGEAPPIPSVIVDPPVSAEPDSVPLPTAASQETPESDTSAGLPDQTDSVQPDITESPVTLPESASETASGETTEEPGTSRLSSQESEPASSVEPTSPPASNSADSAPREENAASMEIRSDHLIRAQLSTGLANKEPIDQIPNALTMDSSGLIRIYLFTEVQGMKGQLHFHDWYRNDERVARVAIRPSIDPMRASSAKYIDQHMLGDWRVEVVTEEGDILATGAFAVLAQ